MIPPILNNRYQLGAELGRGGMGTVYRGKDLLLNRSVAVKVLSETGLGSEGWMRLLIEAQSAARLNHPNIVTVYDAGEVDGVPFIVMELAPGKTLRQVIDGGDKSAGGVNPAGDINPASGGLAGAPALSLEQVMDYAGQICAALDHAHQNGVVHRDLKPENVMVCPPVGGSEKATLKLMDFGLARSVEAPRLTQEGILVGTLAYVAPELISGDEASPQSDLYALGVMLYEMTAGRAPFEGGMIQILGQHLHATPAPPTTHNSQIPTALESLILGTLAKAPGDRPASAQAAAEALKRLARPGQPAALPEVEPAYPSQINRLVQGNLVARDLELNQALKTWGRSLAGEAGLLLLSGEPGIGKTRLARELALRAELGGARAWIGECYAEGSAPYAPFTQMMMASQNTRGLWEGLPQALLADLLTLAPALRARFPNVAPNPPLEARAEQQRLFENLFGFLERAATQLPLLLLIEDLHWADQATLAAIRFLARRVRRQPSRLLLALTYRETELSEAPGLNNLLADLQRERLAERVKLTRMNLEQTHDLLRGLFAEEITPEFLESIYRETEGNPFFVEEVCKALVDAGQMYRAQGKWRRPAMSEIQVPQNVRLAIQSRLNRLPETAQNVLRLASVIGREFDYETLKAVNDLSEDTLLVALESAERAQIISEVQRPVHSRARRMTYSFAHALIPATIQEGLSSIRRQRLHLRVGLEIERLNPERLDELAPQLGRHFLEANQWDKAVGYLLQAGERARAVFAAAEAVGYYREALAILKESGDEQIQAAARTAMKLGQLYQTLYEFALARQAYQEAFELWEQMSKRQAAISLPPAPHALRLDWDAGFETLDPALSTATNSDLLISHLFYGLVDLTPEMEILPGLARRWEISEDGRRYLFTLRQDARWSDGVPITADDCEYAWKRAMAPSQKIDNAQYFFDIQGARAYHQGRLPDPSLVGVRALDRSTLAVDLDEPVGHFLQMLTSIPFFPVPRHIVEPYGPEWTAPEHLVGNGPFLLETYLPGHSLTLRRNALFCGRRRGNLERVELTLASIVNNDRMLADYDADRCDFTFLFQLHETMEHIDQNYPGEYLSTPIADTDYLGFDTSRPPFNDLRVRRAFTQALDRQSLGNTVLRGEHAPGTGGFVPPGVPGHLPGIGLPYNPQAARRLLAEAGYPNGNGFPEIEACLSYGGGWIPAEIQFVSKQWREVLGVSVKFKQLEWAELQRRLNTSKPHLYRMGWAADYLDPDSFLRVALNRYQNPWTDPEYTRLLEQARRIFDPTERLKFYQAADRRLTECAPLLVLSYLRGHMLIKPWVKQYPVSPVSLVYWKEVVMEAH